MGCGASSERQHSVVQEPQVVAKGGAQPAFSSKQAMKQIKRIDRVAPRKKMEASSKLYIKKSNGEKVELPYAYLSQTGYYPDELDKPNQDTLVVKENIGDKDDQHAFFGVFDGHGKVGDLCSNFVRMELWEAIESGNNFESGEYYKALMEAHRQTNTEMHNQERVHSFSDMMSGTTAISALFNGESVFISNVGDSRAIAIVEEEEGKRLSSVPLSIDQTPFRKDERERVKKCGARVLTMGQLEGTQDPDIQDYGNEDDNDGDPPRIWTRMGSYPGTAFTRSIGDRVAEEIGVFADPEILERELTKQDKYLLLASDGVFEFITSQSVVDIFSRFRNDLLNACRAIVAEAYRQWLQFETRTDDITCMIIDVQALGNDRLAQEDLRKRKGSFAIELLAQEIRDQHDSRNGETKRKKSAAPVFKGESEFTLDKDSDAFLKMELRPVRRKVANDVGVVSFDPAELEGYVLPNYDKTEEEKSSIGSAIRSNYLFAHLSQEQLDKAINAMEKNIVKEGQVIIQQFDKGDKFYVAASGRYAVEVAVNKMTTDPSGKHVPLVGQYEEPREVMEYVCEEGGLSPSFGELALMYNKPRSATIVARTDGILWSLERKAFHTVLQRDSAHRLIGVLQKVKTFEGLAYNDVARLADVLTESKFKAGQAIVRQGDPGDSFYVIKHGAASVRIKSEGEEEKEVMKLSLYDYFGERALISGEPRAASVIATEDVSCLTISRSAFDEVLSQIQDVLAIDGREREEAAEVFMNINSLDQLKVYKQEIPFFSGSLYRCKILQVEEEKDDSDDERREFATLRRIQLPDDETQREEVNKLLEKELDVLRKVHSPKLTALFENPSTDLVRYQLFQEEFVTDMQSFIAHRPLDPSSNMLKYAVKCIGLALTELHTNRGVLVRGVTPEAILMDADGCLKLTDFRFSKITDGARTFTAAGTPEYMSPEQIKGVGHGFPADFWSLGILICELCNGFTPFANKSEVQIYETITNPIAIELQIGSTIGALEASGGKLLRHLLMDNPEDRFFPKLEEDFQKVPFVSRVRTKESPFQSFARRTASKMTNL